MPDAPARQSLMGCLFAIGELCRMFAIAKSPAFLAWFARLETGARVRIRERLFRLERGNPGKHRMLAGGIVEMKIDYGPGYRVYYALGGRSQVLVLRGGDKRSQRADIEAVRRAVRGRRE